MSQRLTWVSLRTFIDGQEVTGFPDFTNDFGCGDFFEDNQHFINLLRQGALILVPKRRGDPDLYIPPGVQACP